MGIYVGDTEIKGIYLGDTPVKEVYLGDTKIRPTIINFATQGPCPDGFHVPLYNELVALNNAGINIGAWTSSGGDNMRIYLKLPFTGYRLYRNGNANLVAQCSYWSANVYSNDRKDLIKTMTISSSQINLAGASNNGFGEPIRPFKNIAVSPDGSWTVLYQGTGNAGIYHNSSLGLISISSNGTTWITIADKNLGATQVYNNGDTLSDANCGKFYQRGNNYGFPRSGGITTSSTTIDVSTYGPGNYYESSTFIKDSCWTSTLNDNLRGGVDGNVPV